MLFAALAALVFGCGRSDPPQFRLDMMQMIREDILPVHQQEIANTLGAMFGTPDEPFVVPEMGLDLRKLQVAAGAVWSDQQGRRHGLYREHCAHCHGISGDGRGPTAAFLDPYPRDYRKGAFKFKSTERPAPPTSIDLMRILDNGIPGTAMPSFRLLPTEEKEALVEYVRYLSMRGQMETALVAYCVDEGLEEGDHIDTSRQILIDELLAPVAEKWASAEEQIVRPDEQLAPAPDRSSDELTQSIAKGRELFYGKKANCFSCHGDTALGDGQIDYDDWNKAVWQFEQDNPRFDARSLGLVPPRKIKPRNLRQGIYRGGRRPLDLYWRIHAGINGTPMPAAGPGATGTQATLSPEEIWQLVDYVQSLPYEAASQPPVLPIALVRERM
jgi:mono/diheme cytochrome c family protein